MALEPYREPDAQRLRDEEAARRAEEEAERRETMQAVYETRRLKRLVADWNVHEKHAMSRLLRSQFRLRTRAWARSGALGSGAELLFFILCICLLHLVVFATCR
jgi:hypothetical protein